MPESRESFSVLDTSVKTKLLKHVTRNANTNINSYASEMPTERKEMKAELIEMQSKESIDKANSIFAYSNQRIENVDKRTRTH